MTAIEACRLSPSVTAALGISAALGATVEQLFGGSGEAPLAAWAWLPANSGGGYWEAEVAGQEWLDPAETRPMWTPPPDGAADKPPGNRGELRSRRHGTLVIAGCDPAAGLLQRVDTGPILTDGPDGEVKHSITTTFRCTVPRGAAQAP